MSEEPGQAVVTEVTELLRGWRAGEAQRSERLLGLLYAELKGVARRQLARERRGHTLQTTALVHEAYLKLAGHADPSYANRSHFLAVAAKAMRQILVDHAKATLRGKRGAGAKPVELDEAALLSPEPTREVVELDEALEKLAAMDERKARVVELTYFGGLTQEEIAEALDVSVVTVRRDWTFSRAWLYAELRRTD